MIGTEKEFAEKRCTLAMVMFVVPSDERNKLAAGGGDTWRDTATKCIGSRCAQWCWYDYANAQGKSYFINEAASRDFHKGRREPSSTGGVRLELPARGYCGLTMGRD
jgi:hypothetical protein